MAKQLFPHLVYACSGCSDVAQLANDVALYLDHHGIAEMSCISGVGGGVPTLVKKAQSGKPIVAIDGCQLHCVQQCLARHQIQADEHLRLYELGYRKRKGRRAPLAEVEQVAGRLIELMEASG